MRSIVVAATLVASASLTLTAYAGDMAQGRRIFEAKCARCHSLDPTAPGYRGPHLAGLFDRRYGAVEGFPYRMVWVDANPIWTPEHLDSYLEIHLLPEAAERADVSAYLVEATRQ